MSTMAEPAVDTHASIPEEGCKGSWRYAALFASERKDPSWDGSLPSVRDHP